MFRENFWKSSRCRRGRREAGLTILELLIVVAVLATVIAMAIPSLLNARKSAVSSKTIALMKSMTTTNEQYRLRFSSYAASEANLISADLIVGFDPSSNPPYQYTYSGGLTTWSLAASPTEAGVSADNHFFVDQSGVIRFSATGPADANSTPLD
jgi:type II secretory pathway pseudopilin PulG